MLSFSKLVSAYRTTHVTINSIRPSLGSALPLVLRLLLLEDELEDHWQHVEPLGAEDRLDVAHERLVVLLVRHRAQPRVRRGEDAVAPPGGDPCTWPTGTYVREGVADLEARAAEDFYD